MNANITRWTNPILGEGADAVYTEMYGDDGKNFIHVLESSPYEIAVVSRLIAYLEKGRGGKQ